MQLNELVAAARRGKSAVYTFEGGRSACHPLPQLAEDATNKRNELQAWGVRPGMRVGIYAPNSYQWLVHDLALIEIGAISVPFTDDFSGNINADLLERYDISLLLLAAKHARLFAPVPPHIAFLDAENGTVAVRERPRPNDDDLADQHSLVFSSGSAGGLKGLVISRKGVETTLPPIMNAIGIRPGDRMQLFLPMSNLQQRNMCYLAIWYDCDIIITDFTQLFASMKALNPTILIAPPVFFEMVFSEFEKLPSGKRALANALGAVISLLPGEALRRKLAQRLFAPVLSQFGGSMRRLITGMAPIRHDMGRFFEKMQLPLCESYGMVEAGSITFRPPQSRHYASVGRVLDGIELSFREDGEILVHRDNPLTLRYFQCAEGENERTFVAPGTIATGDVGRLDGEGNLFLGGRKKEQIVTPSGHKVHPEAIEQEINNCTAVVRSVAFLKPGTTHLTCVVDLAQPEAPDARALVRKHINAMRSTKRAFQFVEILFAEAPFSVANGMLRPNMKLDRKAIAAKYGA